MEHSAPMEPKENPPKKPFDWPHAFGGAYIWLGFILVLGLSIEKCQGR